MSEVSARTIAAPAVDGDLSDPRSRSVWRWQLVLAFGAVLLAVVIALIDPRLFTAPAFAYGMIGLLVITVAAIAVPWHRAPHWTIALVPLADIGAIGLLAHSSDLHLSYLWVFPVAWLASYYAAHWLVVGLCAVAGILLATGLAHGFSTAETLRLIIVTSSLSFIGMSTFVGATRSRASGRLLRRQSRQHQDALVRARHAEQRSTTLLDSLPAGVAHIDRDGAIRTTNVSFRRLYGLESVPQLHPSRAVEYDERRGEVVPAGETVIARAARGETFADERVWLFDVEGRWRALEASARDSLDGTVVVVYDVTAAAEASRERQSLARIVSHELRNPLTSVIGHTDLLLERDDLPSQARDQLAVIEGSAERMQHLISRILQDPGRDPADNDTLVDLAAIARDSVAAFAPAARAAGVILALSADDEAPILGDGFRLRQAVDNLVGNAVKYTPRGGRVSVTVSSGADLATVSVADTGIGIAADEVPLIFDPYFRATSARDSGVPGTGLGMGITRDIFVRHGGTLDVTSDVGRGTTVTARLPRHTSRENE